MSNCSKAQNEEFPLFYLPKNSTQHKGQTVVDYGIDDAIDININDQDIEYFSRKSHRSSKTNPNENSSKKRCFPLSHPNTQTRLPVYEEQADCWICPHAWFPNSNNIEKTLRTPSQQQIDRLLLDHPDLLIGSYFHEMNNKSLGTLDRHFHPLKYSFDIALKYNTFRTRPKDYISYFHDHFKSCTKRYHFKLPNRYGFLKKLDGILDTIYDVPREVLLDCLDEGLTEQYDLMNENHHLGNCMAFLDDCVLYPQGAMSTLKIDPVSVNTYRPDYEYDLELNPQHGQLIELNSEIKELTCASYGTGQSTVGVRSSYSCTFLAKNEEITAENKQILKEYDTVNTDSMVLSLAVNPYYEGDAIITLEDGSYQNWVDGQLILLSNEQINRGCSCKELFWVHCFYASSPRSFFIVHSEEVQMVDIRTPQKPCKLMIKLPNPLINRMDHLTRACAMHPTDPHKLLLTSEQGLIILDERFINSPVITINHHMRSSPKFMQTWTDRNDSEVYTMAFLAGYKHRDTRCLEFKQPTLNGTNLKFSKNWQGKNLYTKPITSVRKPWRLAYCDSWLEDVPDDSRVLSPGIGARLKQPLIGLGIYLPEAEKSEELFAVQLTKSGDLFYENVPLMPVNAPTDKKKRFEGYDAGLLAEKRVQKCCDWVDAAYESYVSEPCLNESAKMLTKNAVIGKGAIVDALKMQRVRKDHKMKCSKKASKEKFDGRSNSESTCSKTTENLATPSLYATENASFAAKESDDVIRHENEDLTCSSQITEKHPQNCKMCDYPFKKNELKCSLCLLQNSTAEEMLRISYDRKSLLTNKSLGRNFDVKFPNLVKFPERSKDPLSKVLLENWNNEEEYLPIDLENITTKNEKDKHGNEANSTPVIDEAEEELGWFLSESGTLEYRDSWLKRASNEMQAAQSSTKRKLSESDRKPKIQNSLVASSTISPGEIDTKVARNLSLENSGLESPMSLGTLSSTKRLKTVLFQTIDSVDSKSTEDYSTKNSFENKTSNPTSRLTTPATNSPRTPVFTSGNIKTIHDTPSSSKTKRVLDFRLTSRYSQEPFINPLLLKREHKENVSGEEFSKEQQMEKDVYNTTKKSYESPRKKKTGRVMGF